MNLVTPDSSTGMSLTSTCSSPTDMFKLICKTKKQQYGLALATGRLKKKNTHTPLLHRIILRNVTCKLLASCNCVSANVPAVTLIRMFSCGDQNVQI